MEKGINIKFLEEIKDKLSCSGEASLTDRELIALILRSGNDITDVMSFSDNLLKRYGSLNAIAECSPEQLIEENRGMTPAKAAVLKAALEAGKRANSPKISSVTIKNTGDIVKVLGPRMRTLDREHFAAVILNTKNRILSVDTVSIGTINTSLVHPREVFKNAIRKNAYGLILVHNHPSSDPSPSESDIIVTREIKKAGDVIGIKVLDHIIIGGEDYFSFKEAALIS